MSTGSHKPESTFGIWLRRCGAAARIALVCVVGLWLGVQAHHPYEEADRMRAQNDAKVHQTLMLEHQYKQAQAEIGALESPDGIDLAARPLGWVGPGEHAIQPPR